MELAEARRFAGLVATNDVRFIDSSDFDAPNPRRDPRRLYPRRS
ncbi:hypothetical protein ACLB1S_05860 [Escherichia coli]